MHREPAGWRAEAGRERWQQNCGCALGGRGSRAGGILVVLDLSVMVWRGSVGGAGGGVMVKATLGKNFVMSVRPGAEFLVSTLLREQRCCIVVTSEMEGKYREAMVRQLLWMVAHDLGEWRLERSGPFGYCTSDSGRRVYLFLQRTGEEELGRIWCRLREDGCGQFMEENTVMVVGRGTERCVSKMYVVGRWEPGAEGGESPGLDLGFASRLLGHL